MRQWAFEIAEEEYIREGIKEYGYDGFWNLMEELAKQPPTPIVMPLIRRTFPDIENYAV